MSEDHIVELSMDEVDMVAGGMSANAKMFLEGTAFVMVGAGVAAALPFIGAGAVAGAGIAIGAAVLGAGGAALIAAGVG